MTTTSPPAAEPIDAPEFASARLSGPAPKLDLRVDAVRGDIVDIGLTGRVSASRYTAPTRMVCNVARCQMRSGPGHEYTAVSEIICGEEFDVFDQAHDFWVWGRTLRDGYLGWIFQALTTPGSMTHQVTARGAPVFMRPDIKSPTQSQLPFGALLNGVEEDGFLHLEAGQYLHGRHIARIGWQAASPLSAARVFTGAPYVWGGRTPEGVDCSGLVQAALNACGIACPRDTDQQKAALGQPIDFADRAAGDLIFFPGHVGILATPERLFHANAHWMTTLEEPLDDVMSRLKAAGVAAPVIGVRRP